MYKLKINLFFNFLHHLNSAFNFFTTVVESETGIGIEVHTGIYSMAMDGSNKMIQQSNTSPSIVTQNNSIQIKILRILDSINY